MTLREQLASDLAAAVRGYEQTFEWGGKFYPIVRSNQPTDMEIVEGGFNPGIGSAQKPGIDFTFCIAIATNSAGVRGLTAVDGVFTAGFPQIGDLCNKRRNQIKNVGGNEDPASVSLTIYAGSPER